VLVLAAVVLLVLAVGGGTAYALARGDSGGPSTDPTTSPTVSPSTTTPSTPTSPTPSASTAPPTSRPSDEAKAAANFADALVASGTVTRPQAECVATALIDDQGLPALIDAGLFDEDLNFLNPQLDDKPALKNAMLSATVACVASVAP
jgi:septal ring-binding cell division protein DamX